MEKVQKVKIFTKIILRQRHYQTHGMYAYDLCWIFLISYDYFIVID